jgi:hypothetical protein
MATVPKFRIDVDIHNLLMDSSRAPVKPAAANAMTLPGISQLLWMSRKHRFPDQK